MFHLFILRTSELNFKNPTDIPTATAVIRVGGSIKYNVATNY